MSEIERRIYSLETAAADLEVGVGDSSKLTETEIEQVSQSLFDVGVILKRIIENVRSDLQRRIDAART